MNPLRMGSQRNVPVVEIADLPYGADIDAARDAGDTDAVKQIYTTFEREKRKDEGLATRATRHVPKLSFDVPDATDCITEECMAVTCCLPAYALVALYIAFSAFIVVYALESLGSSAAFDGSTWSWILPFLLVFVISVPVLCGGTGYCVVDDSDSGMVVCVGCVLLVFISFWLATETTLALYEMRYLDLPVVVHDIDPELLDAERGSPK